MEMLILLFFILSLVSIPQILIFNQHKAYLNANNRVFSQSTIGNMGFSGSYCGSSTLNINNMQLSCVTGVLDEIGSIGIVPHNIKSSSLVCLSSEPEALSCNDLFSPDLPRI